MTTPTTGPVPSTVAENAGRHAERVTEDATPYEAPEAPEGAVTDDSPALSGVLTEQTPDTDNPDGVDLSTLPEFRSMVGQLPSARFHAKRQLAELERAIPDALKITSGEAPSDDNVLDHIGEVDDMFAAMEALVIDRAKDREAMTAWLIAQESGENALMAAFGKLSETLGN